MGFRKNMHFNVLLISWFFIIGAAIGSFLNVVVYRLPKKENLIYPPSHCPSCAHRIRWYDNIPIISWLVLRGRCRDCGAAISVRYPLVEFITGAMFALLTMTEFCFNAVNCPVTLSNNAGQAISNCAGPLQLYEILLYHLLLLSTLLVAALMEIDRQQVSWRVFAPALAVGIIAPLACPYLRPMHAWNSLPFYISDIVDSGLAVASGGIFAYLAWRFQKKEPSVGLGWGLFCLGIFLGWQSVIVLALLMFLIGLALWFFARRRKRSSESWPKSVWLFAASFAWLLLWPTLINTFVSGVLQK
ncbi:MAG: prepilin peptidase [Thermoguttaceae bacterium]